MDHGKVKNNANATPGYILFNHSTLFERKKYYHHCMRLRVPYIRITPRRKFSEVMYDTARGMESVDARNQIIARLRELSFASAWPKGCGFGCTKTIVGDVTGDIVRIPNESGPAVAKIIMDAFCSTSNVTP